MLDTSSKLRKIQDMTVDDISKMITSSDFMDNNPEEERWMKESLNKLSPEARTIAIEESIRRAVRKHGEDGLTVTEISKLTGIDEGTARNHLRNLCRLREIYSQKRTKRLIFYYPNGKPLWGIGKKRIDLDSSVFEITVAKGPMDKLFFHVLEKRYSILDGEKPEGGILIPFDRLDIFIEGLKEIANKVDNR